MKTSAPGKPFLKSTTPQPTHPPTPPPPAPPYELHLKRGGSPPHFENRSAGPVNKTINLGGVGILVAGGEAHVKLSHVGRLVQGEKTVKKILNEVKKRHTEQAITLSGK